MKPSIAHWMIWYRMSRTPVPYFQMERPRLRKQGVLFYHLNARHTERPF